MPSNGFATILLLVPVLAIPALAIFGLPQFTPVVASPLAEREQNENSFSRGDDELFEDLDEIGSKRKGPGSSRIGSKNRAPKKLRQFAPSNAADSSSGWPDATDIDSNVQDEPKAPSRRLQPRNQEKFAGMTNPEGDLQLGSPSRISPGNSTNPRRRSLDSEPAPLPTESYNDNNLLQAGYEQEEPAPPPRVTQKDKPKGKLPSNSKVANNQDAGALTWQAAVERLNELGINDFRLEPSHQAGQFMFICTYLSPDAPNVAYRFEAVADEPLKAIANVIEQIVDWRRRQAGE
jgi:hypothetical protein